MINLKSLRGANGQQVDGLPVSDYISVAVIPGVPAAQSITVPAAAKYVVFSATADFYADYTGTAAVPSATANDGTSNELNPTVRQVTPSSTISLMGAANVVITCAFYS